MSKNAKRILVLLTMLAMVFVAACSGGNNGNNNTGNNTQGGSGGNSQGGQQTQQPAEPTGPIDISIMVPQYAADVPDPMIEEMIEEMTGYNIEYQWVPDGTYEERLASVVATQNMADAVYQRNANSFNLYKEYMRDGVFWEIGHLIDEFENLSKLNPAIMNNQRVDGKLYTLYIGRPLSRQGVIYRKDWADELGLGEPKTIEDFENMLKAFTESAPGRIGLSDRADLIYGAFKTVSSWFGTPNNWGEKDGQLLPEFMFEEYYDTMDFFKKMYDNGWINQDFPVASKDEQQDMFSNGTSGVYVGALTDVNGLDRKVKEINPEAETDVAAHLGKWNWAIAGYNNAVMFPKSSIKDEERLREVLGFFDATMDPEVANLMRWGIEGEHYINEGGFAMRDAELHPNNIIERYVKGYADQLIGDVGVNNGAMHPLHTLPQRVKAESLIENELLNNLVHDPTLVLHSDTFLEHGQRLQIEINDATYQYMVGDIDRAGFEAAVQRWLDAGGQAIIDEFNADWKN